MTSENILLAKLKLTVLKAYQRASGWGKLIHTMGKV